MTIKSLLVKIGADTSGLEAGLSRAQKSIEVHAGTIRRVGTAMTAAGGMITGALGLVVKKTYELGHEISELSQKTGISTEVLSGYRTAAEMAGVPLDGFARSLGILAKNMVSFDAESVASNAALTSLGISSTDASGKVKPLNTVLLEVADKFTKIEDGATKAALAKAIFGRAGLDLIPILNLGSVGLQEIYDKTKAAGMVFSKEGAEGAARFKEATIILQTSVQGLGASVATNLMPALLPLIGSITKIVQGLSGWIAQHPGLMKVLVPLIAAIGVLATVLGPILIMLPGLAIAFTALTGPIGIVVAAIAGLIAIGTLVATHWEEIKGLLVAIWAAIQTAATVVWTEIAGFFTGLWETIKGVFVGGWEAVKLGFVAFGTGLWEVVQSIVQGIVDKFMYLWNKVKEITTWIKDHTIGIFKKMWDKVSGHSIVPEMVASVVAHFVNMKTGIGGTMDDIGTKTETGFGTVASYADAMATSGSESSAKFADNLKGSVRSMLKILEGNAIAFIITKVMAALPFPFNLLTVAGAIAAVKTLFGAIRLAEGGIVTGPTLAMIGERGPEAVIPLDRAGAFAGAGVSLRQNNYFYGDIHGMQDIDAISKRLAERTTQAISKGRRY